MGGYGALHNGLRYSDTFSHIVALSSAVHMFKEAGDGFLRELACFENRKAAEKTGLNPKIAFENAEGEAACREFIWPVARRMDCLWQTRN